MFFFNKFEDINFYNTLEFKYLFYDTLIKTKNAIFSLDFEKNELNMIRDYSHAKNNKEHMEIVTYKLDNLSISGILYSYKDLVLTNIKIFNHNVAKDGKYIDLQYEMVDVLSTNPCLSPSDLITINKNQLQFLRDNVYGTNDLMSLYYKNTIRNTYRQLKLTIDSYTIYININSDKDLDKKLEYFRDQICSHIQLEINTNKSINKNTFKEVYDYLYSNFKEITKSLLDKKINYFSINNNSKISLIEIEYPIFNQVIEK